MLGRQPFEVDAVQFSFMCFCVFCADAMTIFYFLSLDLVKHFKLPLIAWTQAETFAVPSVSSLLRSIVKLLRRGRND